MRSSSDSKLRSRAFELKKTLKNDKHKQDINAFWITMEQEKKEKNLEERIELAEMKSKLFDAEQYATMKN